MLSIESLNVAIYVNTVPMLLTEMTSRKSSENKSRSYRQCVENIQGPPKLKFIGK